MDKVVLQYSLAALSVVALVVINLWGVESDVVNAALVSVLSSTVWGGIQRKAGYQKGLAENKEDNS